jgi:hypothetical protein
MKKCAHTIIAIGIAVVLAACGDSPVQPTQNPNPNPNPNPTPLQPTFSSINTQVFQGICVGCHNAGGAAFAGGLRLDAGQAYNQLVNTPSTGKSAAVRVIPGNASDSYLIHKLEGRSDIVGSRMPLNGPFLSQADIDVIRTWIAQGAQNN